ncbi:MarR family transcriptional regulator [Corticibacter populi]|uniref:MarR family transcriptional regulator n=1 Tax=Corticibacter populi TaxID=1550736 RepID=A0A3M6QNE1_9BURK|nr:MarR family transcriptional regulator [Corticibacter populi]RMX04261.1 MarR family transcriptional regulator [Corticibacter populi]RZS33303.1 MarR family transcriptional regulator [Corticibacter populi]
MTDRAQRMQEEWRREWPGIDAKVMATAGRLLEAAQLMEREWLAPFAARFKLQKGEFDVIATLRRAGKPYMLTPTELYEGLMLSSGAMTSRIDRLESNGLIERQPSPADRRSIQVRLTPAGLALIEQMLPLHVANEQQALASLSAQEQVQLDALLSKLIGGLMQKPDGL